MFTLFAYFAEWILGWSLDNDQPPGLFGRLLLRFSRDARAFYEQSSQLRLRLLHDATPLANPRLPTVLRKPSHYFHRQQHPIRVGLIVTGSVMLCFLFLFSWQIQCGDINLPGETQAIAAPLTDIRFGEFGPDINDELLVLFQEHQ